MPSNKAKNARYIWIILVLLPGLLACTFITNLFGGAEPGPEPDDDPQVTQSADQSLATPTPSQEMVTIFTLDEGEQQVPAPAPDTYSQLLEENVEEGIWERGEGFVLLLSYLAGEMEGSEIPGFEPVMEPSPTILLRLAFEYLEGASADDEYADEMERLLDELIPSQEDLDRLTGTAATSQQGQLFTAGYSQQGTIPSECAAISGDGFSAEVDTGEFCYVSKAVETDSGTMTAYFPKWWQDEADKMALVDNTLDALVDSEAVYAQLGTFGDVNAAFSISQPSDSPTTLAYEVGFSAGEPCPITVLPLGAAGSSAVYKQTIAHEAFHCFQDWNYNMSPYSVHKWWGEGSAEYFSNVVYPDVNDEHQWTGSYYSRSIRQPWFDMSYHNFALFQYFGNKLGNSALISLLDSVSSAGAIPGQASTLAGYPNMGQMFEEFVVATMSDGVTDTGGGQIVQSVFPVLRIEPVDQEGEEEFVIDPFVAGRFAMRYEQERRFLQEAIEDENVSHSTALNSIRRSRGSWSRLPPEVRTSCEDDEVHALAISAVENPGIFKANITLEEEAVCDPCLLGTWDMDTESFEDFLDEILAEHGAPQIPAGVSFEIDIQPHQYIRFDEEGEMTSRRDSFTIVINSNQGPPLRVIIDAQGTGTYSADGEKMELDGLSYYVNSVQLLVEGVDISATMNTNTGTYRFFGNTASGPGLGADDSPDSASATYVCNDETLEVTVPEGGPVIFDRVDEIMPTLVPTPSQ